MTSCAGKWREHLAPQPPCRAGKKTPHSAGLSVLLVEARAELQRQRRIESASRERRRQTLQNIQRTAASAAAAVGNAAAAVRNAQSGSGRRGTSPNESDCVTIPNVRWCGSR